MNLLIIVFPAFLHKNVQKKEASKLMKNNS